MGATCTDRQPLLATLVVGPAQSNIHSEGLRGGELAPRDGPLEGAHSGASSAEVAKQTPLDQRQKSNAQTEAQAGSLMEHYLESFGAGGSIGVGGPLGEAKRADCGPLVGARELTVGENCNTRQPSGAPETRDSEKSHPKGAEIGTSLAPKRTAGRPLGQAATNRAKFAIRSYTIAVSKQTGPQLCKKRSVRNGPRLLFFLSFEVVSLSCWLRSARESNVHPSRWRLSGLAAVLTV